MPSDSNISFFDEIQQTLKQAAGDRLLLAKMESAEKTSILAGKLIFAILAISVAFFMMLFLSLMAAYYFSQLFESYFIGFAIVAGFYLLLLILLLWKGKNLIARNVESHIISTIFHEEDENWEQEHSTNKQQA